jgi:hypothetical protein
VAQNAVVAAGGGLTEWISVGVLAASVPRDAVDEAVAECGRQAKRSDGKLPPHVMVYFAMGMALFADDDYVVLEPGLGEISSIFGWIAPAVAADTRVCVYDRAGRGWYAGRQRRDAIAKGLPPGYTGRPEPPPKAGVDEFAEAWGPVIRRSSGFDPTPWAEFVPLLAHPDQVGACPDQTGS